uniref:Transmembrane protein n=1 Tax=Ascaris lumbricoides TaxID=6252 RepID=A0A0M3IPV1_ASCLU
MEGMDHMVTPCDMPTDRSAMVVLHIVIEALSVLMAVACLVLYWVDTISILIINLSDNECRWIINKSEQKCSPITYSPSKINTKVKKK